MPNRDEPTWLGYEALSGNQDRICAVTVGSCEEGSSCGFSAEVTAAAGRLARGRGIGLVDLNL